MTEPLRVLGLELHSASAVGPAQAIMDALNNVGGAAALAQSALGVLGAKGGESVAKVAAGTPALVLQSNAMAALGQQAYGAAEAKAAAAAAARGSVGAIGALTAALGPATIAMAAFATVLGKVKTESIEAQNADTLLAASLRASGATVGRTAHQIDELVNSIEDFSTFSDEAAKRAAAMLFVFDKVRGTTFDRTLLAATDLAAFMGTDLPAAAQMLGRALQDPEKGLMALQRQLRLFTEDEEKAIKQMAQMGNVAGAQSRILSELESKVKGTASEMQDNLGGALKHLTNEFGNLFEVTKERSGFIIRTINGIADAISRIPKGTLGDVVKGFAIGGPNGPAAIGRAVSGAVAGPDPDGDQRFAEAMRRRHAASVAHFAALQDEKNARDALNRTIREATVAEEAELNKLIALNAAHGQTALQLQIIGIQQDAIAKKRAADASGALPQVIARIKELADAQARQMIIAAQNADARAFSQDIAGLNAQIVRQEALNAAHGEGALALQRLAIEMDAVEKKRQYALSHSREQAEAYGTLVDRDTVARIAAAETAHAESLRNTYEAQEIAIAGHLRLNAAHGQASQVLARIVADNRLHAELQQNRIGKTAIETAKLDELSRARHAAAVAAAEESAAAAHRTTIASGNLEVERLQRLNDIRGASALQIAKLNIMYDLLAAKQQNAIGHTAQETEALNTLAERRAQALLDALEGTEAEQAAKRMQAAFAEAFQNIAARGKASFADLFAFINTVAKPGSSWSNFGQGGALFVGAFDAARSRMQQQVQEEHQAVLRAEQEIDRLRQMGESIEDFAYGAVRGMNAVRDSMRELTSAAADLSRQAFQVFREQLRGVGYSEIDPKLTGTDADIAVLQEILSTYQGGGREAAEAYLAALIRIRDATYANAEALDRERQARVRAMEQDLRVQTLRLQGHNDEADALALDIEYQQRRTDALQNGGKALLDDIDAWYAAAKAAQEAAKAERELAIARQTQSLEAQYRRLIGDEAGARDIERQLQLEQAANEAQRELLRMIFAIEDTQRAAAEAAEAHQKLADAMALSASYAEQLAREEGRFEDADRIALDEWYKEETERIRQTAVDKKTAQDLQAQLDALYGIKLGKIGAGGTTGGGGGDGGAAPQGTSFNAFDGVSAEKGDVLVDLTRSHLQVHRTTNTILWMIERNTRGGASAQETLNNELRVRDHSRDVDN